MQILINQKVFNNFNNLVSFTSKKELKNFSSPLTEDNAAFEAVSLAKSSDGIAQVAMQKKSAEISPEIQRKVQEFAKRFGVSSDAFLKIAQKEPKFFNRNLEILDKNIKESAKKLGIPKSMLVKSALMRHALFFQSPEKLDKNITEAANSLEIEKSILVKSFLRQPQLFYQSPETLDKNITDSAQRFGVEKSKFVDAALKQPQLFYQSPETLDKNITDSAERFGVEKSKFVEVALKRPSLFHQSPETLDKNITESARRFGVEKSKFVNAALRKPTLFYQSPETLERKARIYSYYKELRHQPINNLLECLSFQADKHLLAQVLGVLINQQTEKNVSVNKSTKYNQIKEFLEKNSGSYDLKIQDRKIVTEQLLEFSSRLEKELLNKVKFNFKVV